MKCVYRIMPATRRVVVMTGTLVCSGNEIRYGTGGPMCAALYATPGKHISTHCDPPHMRMTVAFWLRRKRSSWERERKKSEKYDERKWDEISVTEKSSPELGNCEKVSTSSGTGASQQFFCLVLDAKVPLAIRVAPSERGEFVLKKMVLLGCLPREFLELFYQVCFQLDSTKRILLRYRIPPPPSPPDRMSTAGNVCIRLLYQ